MAPKQYRGLARRTLFDFLCMLQERGVVITPGASEGYGRVWDAYQASQVAGFGLAPVSDSDEFLVELIEFVGRISWPDVPEPLRCAFEFVLAVESAGGESAAEVMRMARSYAASSTIVSGAELKWLGFDLLEQRSSWSALANIRDWEGPRGSLNAHGLCGDMEQMARIRDLYFRCTDPDRMPPDEYSLWGVMRTSVLDRVGI